MKIDYDRGAQVVWEGDLEGSGTLTTESGALGEQPVSFYARLNHPKRRHQTTPEELIAAAHATDFAMVLAVVLTEAGRNSQRTTVSARCAMERLEEGGYKLSGVTLEVRAQVPGASQQELEQLAQAANEICPLSIALSNSVPVSITAVLEHETE
jgi:osmotically inducible protein OsmC